MKLDPKFAVLFAVFSIGKKNKLWLCSGAFVEKKDAEQDARIEDGRRRKTIIQRIVVLRPAVKP